MEDVRTRRGADIASDHHLVVANLKLKLKRKYIEANKQVRESIKVDKQKHVEELATTEEKAAREGNMKQLYDTTKKLAGKYSKLQRPVKDKEGRVIT
ncbi:unnamed protein product [Schistosoma curassoni]|uniref:Ribosome biogenesis protein RLP24 n=1 Tax=Schistosoma curassoni TaxID=6186 RepID=A0A183KYY1_9TREM|nr:unnamed protein product [Schistosoma curassoni]